MHVPSFSKIFMSDMGNPRSNQTILSTSLALSIILGGCGYTEDTFAKVSPHTGRHIGSYHGARSKKTPIRKPAVSGEIQAREILTTLQGSSVPQRLAYEKQLAPLYGIRSKTWEEIPSLAMQGYLVKVADIANLIIDERIGDEGKAHPQEREYLHYLTPVAKHNLSIIAAKVREISGKEGKVTSLNRTTDYVARLQKHNLRATSGSTHEYGTTFDITRYKYFTLAQEKKLDAFFLENQKRGSILVIKERGCYHIFSRKKIDGPESTVANNVMPVGGE